ncbi:unnamed protein product [Tilletia controversa]|nr:unnamed protein product [Tilletia controversa]CAD6984163.1 unnamed protein product [Tilletia controversa]
MKGSSIDTAGLPHHRILGQILYELICRESSGDGVRIADLRRELTADETVARAYPHNLSKAISNSLRRLLWDGKIIREARGFYQVAPPSAVPSATSTSASQPQSSSAAASASVAGPSGSSAQGKMKNKAHPGARDVEHDDLPDSEDESTSRKKPKLSSPPGYSGLPPPPQQYPDMRYSLASTSYQHTPYYPQHIEGYSTTRPSFGTSWERNPPIRHPNHAPPSHSYEHGQSLSPVLGYSYGQGHSYNPGPGPSLGLGPSLGPSLGPGPGHSYGPGPSVGPVHQYSLSHNTSRYHSPISNTGDDPSFRYAPAPSRPYYLRPHHPGSRSGGLHPAASQIAYEISTHFPDTPNSKDYSGPSSSSGRHPQTFPTKSPMRTPYPSIGSTSSSYSSGAGAGIDTPNSTPDVTKPLSIANLLSRPTSPTETLRQQFAKRCPSLAKLVLEALQNLSGPQRPGVSSLAIQDWVNDRLTPGYGPVDYDNRARVGRAADLMLSSLCSSNLAVEAGTDERGEMMYSTK